MTRKFKLRLSVFGKNIRGEWLCRCTGAAYSFQDYCATYGTPRVFTWYEHTDGKSYLKDQEGNWLSWELNCVKMRLWGSAIAWKLENGHLIDDDGNYLIWKPHQHWAFADEIFLMVGSAKDGELITVEEIDEEPTPVEELIETMATVYQRRHKLGGPDRYIYGVSGSMAAVPSAERHDYLPRTLSFFGVHAPTTKQRSVSVYLLSRPDAQGHLLYRLSLQTEADGFTLAQPQAGEVKPDFYAFDSTETQPYLAQVYEHRAENPTRFIYDFESKAHDDWSAGTPIFRAITPREAQQALVSSVGSQSARRYALDWADKHGQVITEMIRGLSSNDINAEFAEKFGAYLQGLPNPRFYTLGAGFHGGYGVGTVGIEMGSIWTAEDFGYVPMRQKLSDYSVEWVTFGAATGVDLGASADAFAFGVWFGDLGQINGACNGVTISGQVFGGVSINLLWDGAWQGADYSPHPIGVTVVVAAGLEAGGGVFYNASTTQFWNRQPGFPNI